jgi:hypothetical protein
VLCHGAARLQRIRGDLRFHPPKTRHFRRTIPLPAFCIEALRKGRSRQAAERLAVGEYQRDHGLVLPTKIGSAVEPRNLNRHF